MAKKKRPDARQHEQRSVAGVLYRDFENLPGEFRVLLAWAVDAKQRAETFFDPYSCSHHQARRDR